SSGATTEVDAEDAGPLASPSPTAITMSGRTKATYFHDAETNIMATRPATARMNPETIAARVPILTAIGVISGVTAIIPAAAGSVARPAWSGLNPSAAGFW